MKAPRTRCEESSAFRSFEAKWFYSAAGQFTIRTARSAAGNAAAGSLRKCRPLGTGRDGASMPSETEADFHRAFRHGAQDRLPPELKIATYLPSAKVLPVFRIS